MREVCPKLYDTMAEEVMSNHFEIRELYIEFSGINTKGLEFSSILTNKPLVLTNGYTLIPDKSSVHVSSHYSSWPCNECF